MTRRSCGFPPVIKWSGSKRVVANEIARLIGPCHRYHEPFVGGAAVLAVINATERFASDIEPSLIAFWKMVRDFPMRLAREYRYRWETLQERGKDFFYEVRKEFNESRRPEDLLFLSRTCVNGLVRFNSRGEFNNSFHHSRPGIHPDRLENIILKWSSLVAGVVFRCLDFAETLKDIEQGDVVYLDPPYANNLGRFGENVSPQELFEYIEELNEVGAKVALSYDGWRGGRKYKAEVPQDLFQYRMELYTGLSPFKRLQEGKREIVFESLYLNWKPFLHKQTRMEKFGRLR